MVLRIYWILIVTGIIGFIISAIFKREDKNRGVSKRYSQFIDNAVNVCDYFMMAFCAVFILYNVFTFGYCIIENHKYFCIMPTFFLLFLIFLIITDKVKAFDFLTEIISGIFCVCWMVYLVLFSLFVAGTPMKEIEVTEKYDLVETIDIVEFTQAPYNNITGGRYYIKSSPSSAYYYEVRTQNGGTTTKVIDGSCNYVEKIESEEYTDNPHIEVYRSYRIEHYISWYGNEVTEESSSSYSYFIYMPENSIFYEQ